MLPTLSFYKIIQKLLRIITIKTQKEQILSDISRQIHSYIDLSIILQNTMQVVRQLLATDRVLIYSLDKGRGKISFESTNIPQWSICNENIRDDCFDINTLSICYQSKTQVLSNVHYSNLNPCYVEFLDKIHVKSNLVVPILVNRQLWGLLAIHHCSNPHYWLTEEIVFVEQVALQLAIAIQQAILLDKTPKIDNYSDINTSALILTDNYQLAIENASPNRPKFLGEITKLEELFYATFKQAAVGIVHLDLQGYFVRINSQFSQIVGYTVEELLTRKFLDITYPEDAIIDLKFINQLIAGEINNFNR
jgi:PAS domain-containing protein